MTRIALIAAAAMLAGTCGVAGAQTTSPSTSTSVNQGKCWDSALNQVRDKSAGTTSSSGSSAMPGSNTTTGSSTSGTSSTLPSTGSSSGTATTAQTRPPGMPNC
jgi:hypothetical protein